MNLQQPDYPVENIGYQGAKSSDAQSALER